MYVNRGSYATPRWAARCKQLRQSALEAGEIQVAMAINEAQNESVAHTPVFDPMPQGQLLPPPRRNDDEDLEWGTIRGREWIRTVVRTLVEEYNLKIPEPSPGALQQVVDIRYPVLTRGDLIIGGFASRRELDHDTRYEHRLLLLGKPVMPEDRGRASLDSSKPRTRDGRKQLLWWNWDLGKWQSASQVASPQGTAKPLPGVRRSFNGAKWRGQLQPGSGYWEEQEFGTMLRQVAPFYIPKPDESLTMIYLRRGVAQLSQVRPKDGGMGIPAALYLTRGALKLIEVLYHSQQARDDFRTIVRDDMED